VPKKIWQKVINNGDFNLLKNKPLILKSWKRSVQFGIVPYNINNRDDELSHTAFKELRDKYGELIFIATPIITNLYFTLKGTNTAIYLIEKDGYILKAIGDNEILNELTKIRLVEGANWHEKSKGTNGIGTALIEQKPVSIHAEEHFCEPFHHLSCFAAPIFDTNKNLIALLDVTLLAKQAHPHLMALVIAAAKAIETQLYANDLKKRLLNSVKQSNLILNNIDYGIFWVNQLGYITYLNSICSNKLGVDASDLIGRHIEDVFNLPASFKEMISDNVKFLDRSGQIKIDFQGNTLWCQLKPLVGPLGEKLGIAFSLSPKTSTITVVKPRKQKNEITFEDIIGNSNSMKESIRLAMQAATTNLTILLTGETGTGKEVFARAIHNESHYNKGPFIAINCGAIPETLIESELFGYEDGAFTGAKKGGRPGKFELANNGTIFLDEIGEMPLYIQVKLLRVLQEREIVRVGGVKTIPIDVRVIAATNKDLESEIKQGQFRQDLYYRLNVINIKIPPLRERREDILPLANHFLSKAPMKCSISPPAESILCKYFWPGNVREHENIIQRAASFCISGIITPNNLPNEIKRKAQSSNSHILTTGKSFNLKNLESLTIVEILKQSKGNCTLAAKRLGISRTTLYRKLKALGIQKEEFQN